MSDTIRLNKKGKHKLKLKQIIILLFVFLSVLPTTILGIANMYIHNNNLAGVLENDLKNTVSTQMKAINNFLEERRGDAEIIVRYRMRSDTLSQFGDRATPAAAYSAHMLSEILSLRVRHSPYIESATILSPDFTVLYCSEVDYIGETSNLKDIDPKYLTPELTFTPVIETKRDGSRSHVIAAVQETYGKEGLTGYLVLELNLSFFEEIRDSAKIYNNGTIYIIDGNNNMVTAGDAVSRRESFVLTEEERSDYHRAWNERDRDASSGILRYKARGDHYLTYYSKFDSIDWIIFSSVNIDEVLRTKEGFRDLFVQIAVALACLLVAVNYIVRHYLGRPIQKMIDTFERIERTKDYSIRMEKSESSEISTVSAGINSLLEGMEQFVKKEKKIQAGLKVKAERDPLTGLFNKETFTRLVGQELTRAQESGSRIACVFLDVDDFKDFNTNHGHAGGDKVLIFIAEAMRSQIGGLACRQGGDEFTVCIPDASDLQLIRRKIHDFTVTLRHGLRLEEKGGLISVSCSIGIVFSDRNTVSAEQLVKRSDEVMYEVKKGDKNGYKILDN